MVAQFIKFVGIGGINTIATYLLYLLLLFVSTYQVSYTIAYLSGIFLSYWLNLKFVFQERGSTKKMLLYPFVYLGQYIVGMFILYVTVDYFNIPQEIGPIIVVLITLPMTFFLSKTILTNKIKNIKE